MWPLNASSPFTKVSQIKNNRQFCASTFIDIDLVKQTNKQTNKQAKTRVFMCMITYKTIKF